MGKKFQNGADLDLNKNSKIGVFKKLCIGLKYICAKFHGIASSVQAFFGQNMTFFLTWKKGGLEYLKIAIK